MNAKVFISSTIEDLKEARAAALRAVERARCQAIAQESFVASGDRPPLEECLESVSESDLVVVIVGHRYGWVPPEQPGGSKKSITWLECERAVSRGKSVLAFLLDENAEWPEEHREDYRLRSNLKEVTVEEFANIKERARLLGDFKAWLRAKGIVEFFHTTPDIAQALNNWLARARDTIEVAKTDHTDASEYLKQLRERTAWIDIRGLQVSNKKAHRIRIRELYVPLTTVLDNEGNTQDGGIGQSHSDLDGALSRHLRLVIQGDPGSGKSTYLNRIAFELADALVRNSQPQVKTLVRTGQTAFPMLVRASEFAKHIADVNERPFPENSDPRWLAHYLAASPMGSPCGLDQSYFERKLGAGEAIVLVDGLDEAPEGTRHQMADLLIKAGQLWRECQFVVTTRPAAYTDWSVMPSFQCVQIEPLQPESIDEFLERWCSCLYPGNAMERERQCSELQEAVRRTRAIREMAGTPVMLTALAALHSDGKSLPNHRAELLESIVVWLASSRERRRERENWERALTVLQTLALGMQQHASGRQVHLPRKEAAGLLMSCFAHEREALQFLDEEEQDSGIIVGRGPDIRFWHLTLQEHLAAREIAGLPDADQKAVLIAEDRIYKQEWREVVLLLAGILWFKQGAKKVDGLMSLILEDAIQADDAKMTFANRAQCIELIGKVVRDLRTFHYAPADARYGEMLKAAMTVFASNYDELRLDVRTRSAVGDAIGLAGDPRLLQRSNWITLKGCTFWMGGQKSNPQGRSYDPEAHHPAKEETVDTFRMRRYPVTVFDYQRFIAADGYRTDRHWGEGGFGEFKEPKNWAEQQEFPNKPVVGVSWFEAAAFCAWFRGRLPTEKEWERAARGPDSTRYPWGDNPEIGPEYANYDATGLGVCSAVGLFPKGNSVEGLCDLLGNVWEWCFDGNERCRVLHGGAWFSNTQYVRTSFELWLPPWSQISNVGFRCAGDAGGAERP